MEFTVIVKIYISFMLRLWQDTGDGTDPFSSCPIDTCFQLSDGQLIMKCSLNLLQTFL